MFAYEKINDKKWPFRVTKPYRIRIFELNYKQLKFRFPDILGQVQYFAFFTFPYVTDGSQYLNICKGYAWDGCSGPVPTTVRSARASCVHDVLYQSMREGLLGQEYRAIADKIFYRILIEDGMPGWIAWGYYMAVRIFGAGCCKLKKQLTTKDTKSTKE